MRGERPGQGGEELSGEEIVRVSMSVCTVCVLFLWQCWVAAVTMMVRVPPSTHIREHTRTHMPRDSCLSAAAGALVCVVGQHTLLFLLWQLCVFGQLASCVHIVHHHVVAHAFVLCNRAVVVR